MEELRNIQEQISLERAQWNKEKEAQEEWIQDKKVELQKLQDHLREQQKDILQQREDLFRQLETLQNQGISLSPGMMVITTMPAQKHDESQGNFYQHFCSH